MGEVDARRDGERSKETTRSAVVDVLERAPVERGGGGGRVGPAVRRKDGLARP